MSAISGNPTTDALIDFFGGIAAVLNIVGIAALVWFKTQYKKILARHQHELALHQIQFSSVYTRREELLRQLYRNLALALDKCLDASKIGNFEEIPAARQKMIDTLREMEEVAIYFPEEICKKWNESISEVVLTLDRLAHLGGGRNIPREEYAQAFDNYWASVKAIRISLRGDLRKILGTTEGPFFSSSSLFKK